VYVQATWRITPRFSVTPGIRLDRYGLTGETLTSPRFAARFSVNSKIALTFGSGIYRQPPSLFVLSLTPNNRRLKSQTATHLVGGIEWLAREDLRVRFEVYRKNYDRLIVQPLRPTQNFASDGNYFNSGSGTSQGLEISVQKALTGFFSGQASYAYVNSRRRFSENSFEFPSDFERPHQLTLIGISRFFGFSVAAKYRLASGLPYTRRTPLRVFPNSQFFLQRVASEQDINALRLPDFASLDVRAEKRFSFKRFSFAPYIDYFNVTNHDSVVQPNYEFYQRTPQFLSENQRFPIFGLRLEF
jgi:outer membrane receptor protein involved in Fe transport